MVPQRFVTTLQFLGAALGIPAAAAGSYTAYQNYFSSDATCQRLRTNIVTIMERRVSAETKWTLLRKDVAEFDKTCGDGDPDARTVFQAALQENEQLRTERSCQAAVCQEEHGVRIMLLEAQVAAYRSAVDRSRVGPPD